MPEDAQKASGNPLAIETPAKAWSRRFYAMPQLSRIERSPSKRVAAGSNLVGIAKKNILTKRNTVG